MLLSPDLSCRLPKHLPLKCEDALFTCDNAMVACTTFLCPGCCCLIPNHRKQMNLHWKYLCRELHF